MKRPKSMGQIVFWSCALSLLAAGAGHAAPPSARAASDRWFVAIYAGASHTADGDLELRRPGGTSLTIDDVDWRDASFEDPIFYGWRAGAWLGADRRWGVAVDFTHAKTIARTSQRTRIHGRRAGVAVREEGAIAGEIEAFELSHGHNVLTADALRRWAAVGGRWQLYAGAGVGVALPHVEAVIDGEPTSEYQVAGPAATLLIGAETRSTRHLAPFFEYKITWADVTVDAEPDAELALRPLTHQLIVGVGWLF